MWESGNPERNSELRHSESEHQLRPNLRQFRAVEPNQNSQFGLATGLRKRIICGEGQLLIIRGNWYVIDAQTSEGSFPIGSKDRTSGLLQGAFVFNCLVILPIEVIVTKDFLRKK